MISAVNVLICAAFLDRLWNTDIWYALPPIISISLVYAATRHEAMGPILGHAVRTGLWIAGFMAVFFFILWMMP